MCLYSTDLKILSGKLKKRIMKYEFVSISRKVKFHMLITKSEFSFQQPLQKIALR